MPRQGFWWQTRSARREFPRRVSRNKKGELLFPGNGHPQASRATNRSSTIFCGARPAKPGEQTPKATGHLRACLELRRPVKSCGEELKKMRRICLPNWTRRDLLPRRQEESQVFRDCHRSPPGLGFRKCVRQNGLWPFPQIHRPHHNNKLYALRFKGKLLSRKYFAVHILRNEMEFTRSARRGGSASNRRNSRCPRPRE
jgi:hypothetical protein